MAAHFSNTGSQDYLERLSKRCLVFTSPYNSTFPLSLCKIIARALERQNIHEFHFTMKRLKIQHVSSDRGVRVPNIEKLLFSLGSYANAAPNFIRVSIDPSTCTWPFSIADIGDVTPSNIF
jgi:hypothetical protein